MGRSSYSAGKRQREREKAKKKREKLEKRQNKESGGNIPIATVDEIQGGLLPIDEVVENVHAGPQSTAGGPAGGSKTPSRLFVGSLDWRVTSEELRKTFESIGNVTDARVITDRDTGDSRGFGFVTMADHRDASTAIEKLDGTELEGRNMVVRLANERGR